jgi:hypothetical protein
MTTITPINDNAAAAEWSRRAHHIAADECICDAISMLSFMELCGQHRDGDEFSMHGEAVRDMAEAIVKKLRDAQKHHREAL